MNQKPPVYECATVHCVWVGAGEVI
eukprot:COSAG06_NODE_19966_length_815_cov_1.431564_1_plen_24_part_10